MKKNSHTRLLGSKVILVPYRKEHVQRYHNWMKDPELQELTASEPLTLEQEYAMQRSWMEDDDKCTFIILDKADFESKQAEIDAMVGDVNLFFNDQDTKHLAEVEVMVAEYGKRHQGLGKEALLLILRYGIEELGVTKFVAKIKMKNHISISMFEKLQFCEVSRSDVFQEVTLEWPVVSEHKQLLLSLTPSYTVERLCK